MHSHPYYKLLSDLLPVQLDALRDARLINNSLPSARAAFARCVMYHALEGADITSKNISNCSGIERRYVGELLIYAVSTGHLQEAPGVNDNPRASLTKHFASTQLGQLAFGELSTVITRAESCTTLM